MLLEALLHALKFWLFKYFYPVRVDPYQIEEKILLSSECMMVKKDT